MIRSIPTGRPSLNKATQAAIKRTEKTLEAEGRKQLKIVQAAFLLALYQYHGFRDKRLNDVKETLWQGWVECARDINKSIASMLYNETGIIVTGPNGEDWETRKFMNPELFDQTIDMSFEEWRTMRSSQIRWLPIQMKSAMLLTMHRKYGWAGAGRLQRLMGEVDLIIEENGKNPNKYLTMLKRETGQTIKE